MEAQPERRKRWWLWALVIGLALSAVAYFALPRLLGSDALRREIEARLSAALDREVTIERLDVDPSETAVTLVGVRIADPPEFGDGALLVASSIRLDVGLDALRHRAIEGALEATGVTLRVVRADGRTNLHGLGHPNTGGDRQPVPLALSVSLIDSQVQLVDEEGNETVDLQGVDVAGYVGAAAGAKSASLDLRVASATVGTLTVTQVAANARLGSEAIAIERLSAMVGNAPVDGSGSVALSAGKPAHWSVRLGLTDAALDEDLVPVVSALYPPLSALGRAMASAPEALDGPGARWGRVTLVAELEGSGLAWHTTRRTLAGSGTITLDDVRIPPTTLLGRIAMLAGHQDGTLTLQHGSAEFELAREWIVLGPLAAEGAVVVPPVTGRVALDGRLDLEVDLMPLVKAYGGGAYASMANLTSTIPVKVGGTVDDPEIRPPSAASVAKGLLGGFRNRAAVTPEP